MDPVNILLVDDQPAKLLSYEVILQELGETLIKATSGREALEHLLKKDVAVILVDVCMPEQDGFELVAMIREHPRFQKTAIIFVSAIMMAEPDRLRGYEAGAVDYVSVPIVPELLRAKVRVFAELYRKTRDLETLNLKLEQRVLERTAQLEASSAQLVALNGELERRVDERTREREEALAQLFEAQKLDTIGQLTGGVAHDFNNLLMAALSSLNILKKRLTPDETNDRLLNNAIHAAERGTALTQRLLAFARRQELKPEAVDLIELVDSMEDLLGRAVGSSIVISNNLPPALPPILVDANQLELALLNLCVNARDAMSGGGTLSISATRIHSSHASAELAPGEYIEIVVADTGHGMDSETAEKAAEPFFTTKGVGKGTGLGLSMVHGLAAQSGGSLRISSTVGVGTKVSVWLPVASESGRLTVAELASTEPAGAEPEARGLRILVVDDDALVSLGTVAMLEDMGHKTLEAHSGVHALELLKTVEVPDLVITDHAMPGMTGMELAEHIGTNFPDLPIILASGYVDLPNEKRFGVLPRLTKPFDEAQLSAAIANVLSTPYDRRKQIA
ncbi:response regulator [Rhizobium sp. TH2]|uniref:response regulator n=1 Tax=Rhizobium sp. TH2 TaxID=2775403 RepID=UPI0021587235|nr:response regulator [Rhizobium sp. TH2]UVC10486.1 response regulator [Rhizobium sp. TH2]